MSHKVTFSESIQLIALLLGSLHMFGTESFGKDKEALDIAGKMMHNKCT